MERNFLFRFAYLMRINKEEKQGMITPDGLSLFTISIYSTGHVLNDLCAAC